MKTLDTLATFEALLGLSNGGAVVLLGHVEMHGRFRLGNRKKRRYFLKYLSLNVRIILKLIWKEPGRRECRLDSYLDRDLLGDLVYTVMNSRVWEKVGKPFLVVEPSSASVQEPCCFE
jgi:hypothetical protein